MKGKDFRLAVLTVPKGFAYRLVPEGKETKLSLIMNISFNTEILFQVPKSAFDPEPKTNSVVVRIAPREKSVLSEILLREGSKLKNAMMESLILRGPPGARTRKGARETIKTLKIYNTVSEKRVKDLNERELKIIIKSLRSF